MESWRNARGVAAAFRHIAGLLVSALAFAW
jgi:hypothetical protein